MKFQKFAQAVVGCGLAFASALAGAAVVYTFDATAVGAFGSGPYGTVTLNDTGSNIDFTVDLRSNLDFVNTGGSHSVFSFNALGVVSGDITNIKFNGVNATGLGFSVISPGGNPPFGSTFTFSIDCTNNAICQNGAPGKTSDPLTFTVLNAEYSDFGFLVAGTTASFAADVICTTGSCNGSTGAIGVTSGGVRPPNEIPEPGSLALAALALLGAAFGVRRT